MITLVIIDLEKQNFEHAGNTLAENWNKMTIDFKDDDVMEPSV